MPLNDEWILRHAYIVISQEHSSSGPPEQVPAPGASDVGTAELGTISPGIVLVRIFIKIRHLDKIQNNPHIIQNDVHEPQPMTVAPIEKSIVEGLLGPILIGSYLNCWFLGAMVFQCRARRP